MLVLILVLIQLELLLFNELLLSDNLHNGRVNLGFEHHHLVLVLTALLVNGNEDLGLADDVIVADDLLVHLNSHLHESSSGISDDGLELSVG